MSKKDKAPSRLAGKAPGKAGSPPNWLAPLEDAVPCGTDLEYDHDFVVLFAGAIPQQDVQYGTFVGSPEPVNWSEIESGCTRLMQRTKDIRVAVLYTRCGTRLRGAAGLEEGTRLLAAWLNEYARHVHPQPGIGDEHDSALEIRMNALQALADPEGLLADVREIVLTKSTVARLQVRDVERALACPRPADALAPESVMQQLEDVHARQPALMASFANATAHLATIEAWCTHHLQTYQPDLSALTRVLEKLAPAYPVPAQVSVETFTDSREVGEILAKENIVAPDAARTPTFHEDTQAPMLRDSEPANRQAALAAIRGARAWFETCEPSSPVPVLLKRAEQFVGKRYADAVRAIPADLLAQWEEVDGTE
ncbi:ImpA family type VI secretion system protein [Bordetella sp. LUAb4]|uniref:type VI secretion system protein TssA n=1 Tax=Bordetella sp. LUAb4 TaxID=2843195 RepID=UPI001E3B6972|nr:type VI secretion system ImpA family N-terminal domain-containing protein [Bordetella sp. LUAb4]